MARRKNKKKQKRVEFRHNRLKPARQKRWDHDDETLDGAATHESVRAKGGLSRRRTVREHDEESMKQSDWRKGTAIAVRGQFVEVEGEDRIWLCTVRRVLRTRRIQGRNPVVVGDQVMFSVVADEEGVLTEGVIEHVEPRRTSLTRSDGRRTHVIAANVDQVLIVSSIREPMIKPHLIDRYLVAAEAGGLDSIVCINKADLAPEEEIRFFLDRFQRIGYSAMAVSARQGTGIGELSPLLKDKSTLLAGQSGVGKSSLINAIQPALNLKTSEVSEATEKGRHTTTSAYWHKLDIGGAVVDTPGIRALDVGMIPLDELEMHFVEFVDRLADCKFPDCVHIHERGCAIIQAVEEGEIDVSRYETYLGLFEELSEIRRTEHE